MKWESNVAIYPLKTKPLKWKQDFFTFHAALRLLQLNKLAHIRDFVPDAPTLQMSSTTATNWSEISSEYSEIDVVKKFVLWQKL